MADSYNVSVNGVWTNITVYAYNSSGGGSLSSTPAAFDTQVANNVPVQTLADNWGITAGNLLTFTVSAADGGV